MGIRVLIIIVFAAATAALTLLFRIPLPATGGYLNVGDLVIIFVGLRFGALAGWGVGAFGSAAADLMGGYASFAPVTFIVKGIEGLIPGWFARKSGSKWLPFLGALLGAASMVLGYFIGESLMPGIGIQAATAEIPGNCFQGLAGWLGGFGLYRAVAAAFQRRSEGSSGQ